MRQDHPEKERMCEREGVLFLHSKEKKRALLPAVVRKDVSVIAESWEEAQRLPEAFWRVLLDLPLDSWHLACDGHHEPPPPPELPLRVLKC